MGDISLFSKEQQVILDEVSQSDFLRSNFYLTGGTILSAIYLNHRYSDDLDFFSTTPLENQIILTLVEGWSKKHNFTFESRFVEVVYIFQLTFPDKSALKVDFAYYPYTRMEPGKVVDGLDIDSLTDIAVNKLLTITQRTDAKDFVDLYFLLKQFSFWDLLEGVRIKFRMELEPILIASDFLKVEEFEFLPKMVKPLDLDDLKQFYRKLAKKVGSEAVE